MPALVAMTSLITIWASVAIPATTSGARWRAEVETRLPRGIKGGGVLFSFGVNDTTIEQGVPRVASGKTLDNAAAMLREAKKLWPVLFIGPPPIDNEEQNRSIAALDEELERAAVSLDVPYLSVFEPLASTPSWMAEVRGNDGAHPRADGYEALAALVRDWPAWRGWFE